MINFKDPKDQTPSALAVVGILAIMGSVVGLFLYKPYSTNKLKEATKREEFDLTKRQKDAKDALYDNTKVVDSYLWEEKEDLVSPAALTIVSQGASANRLKLVGFRPMRSIESDAVVQLPMQFTVNGSFASVSHMIDDFYKTGSKLAVEQVQLASLEGETDQVSASVTVYAFLQKPLARKAFSGTKSQSSSKSSGSKSSGVTEKAGNASNNVVGAKTNG